MVPDGGMAPIDDGNPQPLVPLLRGAPRASCRRSRRTTRAGRMRRSRFDTDGAVDLGADAIVALDDRVPGRPAPVVADPVLRRGRHRYCSARAGTTRSGWRSRQGARHGLGARRPPAPPAAIPRARRPRCVPAARLRRAPRPRPRLPHLHHPRPGQPAPAPQHRAGRRAGAGRLPAGPTGWLSRPAGARPPAEGQSTLARTADGGGLEMPPPWSRTTAAPTSTAASSSSTTATWSWPTRGRPPRPRRTGSRGCCTATAAAPAAARSHPLPRAAAGPSAEPASTPPSPSPAQPHPR